MTFTNNASHKRNGSKSVTANTTIKNQEMTQERIQWVETLKRDELIPKEGEKDQSRHCSYNTAKTNANGKKQEVNVNKFVEKTKNDDSGQAESESDDPSGHQTDQGPDGGFGWVIVFGCFFMLMIQSGLDRSDGIFFLQFVDRYGENAQVTAWAVALTGTLTFLMGPVASAFSTRYSVRTSCMLGASFMVVSYILTGFVSTFYLMFPVYSLLQGIGRGLIYGPGLVIVSAYFNKRRALAAGIASSGVGAGAFIMVPTIQFLFDKYGYRGAFLILAGISSNIFVVAMLFRPLSMYNKFSRISHGVLTPAHQDPQAEVDRYGLMFSGEKHTSISIDTFGAFQCLKSATKILFPVEYSLKSKTTQDKKLFDFALLKHPSFALCCLSIFLSTINYKTTFIYLPALAESRGLSESQAAMTLSIAGGADIVARILAGIVLDLRGVRGIRPIVYNIILLLVVIPAFIFPSLSSFMEFVLTSCVFTALTGAYVAQKSVIIVDILGAENMANSFGLLICSQGIGILIGPPISGAIKDYVGTFDMTFYIAATIALLAAITMAVSNAFLVLDKRRFKENGK